jgi:diguanylate cyclase (GGDEF)-like protein
MPANRARDEGVKETSALSDAELRQAVDTALQLGAPLPAALDERFETRRWRGRSRGTRTWLLAVAIINLLCLGVDALVLPEFFREAVLSRGVVSGMYLGAAWLLNTRRVPWIQGATVCFLAVALVLIAGYLGILAGGVHTERYFTAVLFASFAAAIVPNIPFRYSVLQSILSLLTIVGFVLGQAGGSIGDNFFNNIELVTFYPVCILVALDVRRWMERMQRRNFLLALRDELRVQELAATNAKLTVLSQTDPLTGVFNRRFFDQAIAAAWHDAADTGEWIGVAMVDVDHFKTLNDVAGHAEGDRCLRAIASAVRGHVRKDIDLVARYGGEEFVAVLPGADLAEAAVIAERVRKSVEALGLKNPGRPGEVLTVSVGLVSVQPGTGSLSPEMLLGAADAALYMAKASGRNRVRFAPGLDGPPLAPEQPEKQDQPIDAT